MSWSVSLLIVGLALLAISMMVDRLATDCLTMEHADSVPNASFVRSHIVRVINTAYAAGVVGIISCLAGVLLFLYPFVQDF